jgi:hypothetical protein
VPTAVHSRAALVGVSAIAAYGAFSGPRRKIIATASSIDSWSSQRSPAHHDASAVTDTGTLDGNRARTRRSRSR